MFNHTSLALKLNVQNANGSTIDVLATTSYVEGLSPETFELAIGCAKGALVPHGTWRRTRTDERTSILVRLTVIRR